MITKFKLYESINIDSNLDDNLTSKIIDDMSFIVYKGIKKDGKKSKNYKSIRIKNLNGNKKSRIINNKKENEYIIEIDMTNKDKIYGKYKSINNLESSISIYINDEHIIDMSDEKYDIYVLIDKISKEYKNYLKKEWKIK